MVANFDKKENKDFFNDKLLFKTIGVLFLIGIFVLIVADFRMYRKKQKLISQINAYQKQIEDIKNNSQNLKNEIANSNNTDYLEKLAYEQLGQARPGETLYSFVNSEEKPEETASPKNFLLDWFSNVWQWIKNKF